MTRLTSRLCLAVLLVINKCRATLPVLLVA